MEYFKKTRILGVPLSALLAYLLRISVLSDAQSLKPNNCPGTVEFYNDTYKGSDPLPTPSISCPKPAVRPGGDLQITCSTPYPCTTVELYRDGSIVKTSTSMSKSSVFNLSNMESSKQGQYSCSYTIQGTDMKSPKSGNITITVVTLKQPSIFLSSEEDALCPPNPGSQSVEVTKGHSFSIICCTVSQYEGGSFLLLLNGTKPEPMFNTSANRAGVKQSHNLSASLLFPEANVTHQGNYTCVYEVTVGHQLFSSSQSDPLIVTVKDSWLLLLLLVGGGLLLLFLLLLTIFLAWRYHRGKKRRKSSISDHRYTTGPEGGERYRRNEPVEDDERDYQSIDDEDKEDYVNTATLGCKTGSLWDEEDYVNTETLGNGVESLAEEGDYVNTETLENREESLAEEGDYVNTETLDDGVGDYECMEKHSEPSDGDDYVNVDPVSAVIY